MAKRSKVKLKAEIRTALERTKSMSEDEIEQEFQEALKDARGTAKKYNITQKDIEAEIHTVRAEKANSRRSKKK